MAIAELVQRVTGRAAGPRAGGAAVPAAAAPVRPNPGLNAGSFRKIAAHGFGDPHNAYPHSMAWFRGQLYVGTARSNLAMAKTGIDEGGRRTSLVVWPVKTPKTAYDLDLRAQIWRYDVAAGAWTRVLISPMVMGRGGFEVPMSVSFRAMAVFRGASDDAEALYAPTWATSYRPETLMLRSADGAAFDVVSEPGLGLGDPVPRALRGLLAFRGRLYTAPAVGPKRGDLGMVAGQTVVLESADPARGQWRPVCEPAFGDPTNLTAISFAALDDRLYVGTTNVHGGFQVWRTDAAGAPPYRWTRVLTQGAYRGVLNQIAMTLYPFRGRLYVGSAIQGGGHDTANNVGPAAPELIRVNPDDSWDLVMGEPRLTPDGLKVPLSGLGPGFDKPTAGYLWEMCEHDGWLYAGTAVWTPFLRYSDPERWPARMREILRDRDTLESFLRARGGCDLWRSRDGERWIPVTRNGFGNSYNLGVRRMASTPHGLFVGVANSFGPEVAMREGTAWTYRPNPASGLEVWLGATEGEGPPRAAEGGAA